MKPFNMYFVSVISQKKNLYILKIKGCPGSTVIKISACQCTRCRFDPWVRKIPWRRKWQPTPVFLPGKFHGQRNLAGYSPWSHKELDTTEHACTRTLIQYNLILT